MGHLLTENRHGLVLDVELTEANGYAEREAAVTMLERSVSGCGTLGADRGWLELTAAAYNLVRMATLETAAA